MPIKPTICEECGGRRRPDCDHDWAPGVAAVPAAERPGAPGDARPSEYVDRGDAVDADLRARVRRERERTQTTLPIPDQQLNLEDS